MTQQIVVPMYDHNLRVTVSNGQAVGVQREAITDQERALRFVPPPEGSDA